MNKAQDQLIQDILSNINDVSAEILKDTKHSISNLLGVSAKHLVRIIRFVTNELPHHIYLDKYENVKNYFQIYFIQSLILFLAQEDVKSEDFLDSLINFKNEILNHVTNNVYVR